MTGLDTTSIMNSLKTARDELLKLNRTVKHTLCLASERSLISEPRYKQHVRRSPSTWGVRCDAFYWDAWDRSIRGENDMHRFFEIAERIGGQLDGLEETDAASLLPGTMLETNGSGSNLFLPDYWLFVVHYLGRTGQLSYECHLKWSHGTSFGDDSFAVNSRLPVNIVQASIDALSVLIDAATPPTWEHEWQPVSTSDNPESGVILRVDAPEPESPPKEVRRPRKRAGRATGIELLTAEMRQHVRAAREHIQAAIDFGRESELLPRPSQKELAKRVGITVSAACRCFNDPSAKELRLLWDVAIDLNSLMQYVRKAS